MKRINWLAMAVLTAWLGVVTYRITVATDLPFDAAYNFLAYKNIADRGAYVNNYGEETLPWDPIASTGPTVNVPVLAYYALSGDPHGVCAGTAWTNVLYTVLFCCGFLLMNHKILGGVGLPLLVALVYVTPSLMRRETLFTGLGEHFTMIFIYAGAALLFPRRSRLIVLLGATAVGLAILTKISAVAGLALPALWFLARLPQWLRGVKSVGSCLGIVILLGLGVSMPKLLHSRILPAALLHGEARNLYDGFHRYWENDVSNAATVNWHRFKAYVVSKEQKPLEEIAANLASKRQSYASSKVGTTHMVLHLSLFFLAMAYAWWRRDEFEYVFVLGLYAVGNGLWWFLLNESPAYRYVATGDMAALIVIATALPALARDAWYQGARPLRSLSVVGAAALAVFLSVEALNADYRPAFSAAEKRKTGLLAFSDAFRSLPKDAIFLG